MQIEEALRSQSARQEIKKRQAAEKLRAQRAEQKGGPRDGSQRGGRNSLQLCRVLLARCSIDSML